MQWRSALDWLNRKQRLRLWLALCCIGIGVFFLYQDTFRFWRYLREAERALTLRRHAESMATLQSANQFAPENAEVLFLMARTHRRLGEFEKMRHYLLASHARKYSEKALRTEFTLARAQIGLFDQGADSLEVLLANSNRSDGPEICDAFANGFRLAGRSEDARRVIQAWIADFPQDAQPHLHLGLMFEDEGLLNKAQSEYLIACQLEPKRTDSRLRLSKCLIGLNDHAQAKKHLEFILRFYPSDPDAQVLLARIQIALGDDSNARQLFQEILNRFPKHFEALMGSGEMALSKGQFDFAAKQFRSALECRGYEVQSKYQLARSLQGKGDQAAAKALFQEVAAAREQIARIDSLRDRLRSDPESVATRLEIGKIELEWGNPNLGTVWVQGVLQNDPNNRDGHELLAKHYEKIGNHSLSEHHSRFANERPVPSIKQ